MDIMDSLDNQMNEYKSIESSNRSLYSRLLGEYEKKQQSGSTSAASVGDRLIVYAVFLGCGAAWEFKEVCISEVLGDDFLKVAYPAWLDGKPETMVIHRCIVALEVPTVKCVPAAQEDDGPLAKTCRDVFRALDLGEFSRQQQEMDADSIKD